jgi:putative addiction module killer protein
MIEVVEYESEDGRNHYRKWFRSLPAQHADKVVQALRRMEAGNLGDHKSVGGGVFEHRIHTPALRIYFGRDGQELVILLAGGSKSQQSRDIARAQLLWQEYKDHYY